jgi:hypothetical protein
MQRTEIRVGPPGVAPRMPPVMLADPPTNGPSRSHRRALAHIVSTTTVAIALMFVLMTSIVGVTAGIAGGKSAIPAEKSFLSATSG